jgi:hypothetical protein
VGTGPPRGPERAERYEGPDAPVQLTTSDAEVIAFSGLPDSILVTAHVQDAIVTLTDELGRDGYPIRVPAGTTVETRIARRRVVARAVAAGGLLTVVGRYWDRPPAGAAPREL